MTQQRKFSEVLTEFLDTREALMQAKTHNTFVVDQLEEKMFLLAQQLDAIATPAFTVSYQPAPSNTGYTIQPQLLPEKT